MFEGDSADMYAGIFQLTLMWAFAPGSAQAKPPPVSPPMT